MISFEGVADRGGRDVPAGASSREIAHPKKRAMLAALAKTGNVTASARAAGVGRRTHYEWMVADLAYRVAVEEAKEESIEVLEAVARQRAIHGSDTMLIFLLKSLRPDTYRDRHLVRHAGKVEVVEARDPFEILRDPEVCEVLDRFHARRAGLEEGKTRGAPALDRPKAGEARTW